MQTSTTQSIFSSAGIYLCLRSDYNRKHSSDSCKRDRSIPFTSLADCKSLDTSRVIQLWLQSQNITYSASCYAMTVTASLASNLTLPSFPFICKLLGGIAPSSVWNPVPVMSPWTCMYMRLYFRTVLVLWALFHYPMVYSFTELWAQRHIVALEQPTTHTRRHCSRPHEFTVEIVGVETYFRSYLLLIMCWWDSFLYFWETKQNFSATTQLNVSCIRWN